MSFYLKGANIFIHIHYRRKKSYLFQVFCYCFKYICDRSMQVRGHLSWISWAHCDRLWILVLLIHYTDQVHILSRVITCKKTNTEVSIDMNWTSNFSNLDKTQKAWGKSTISSKGFSNEKNKIIWCSSLLTLSRKIKTGH